MVLSDTLISKGGKFVRFFDDKNKVLVRHTLKATTVTNSILKQLKKFSDTELNTWSGMLPDDSTFVPIDDVIGFRDDDNDLVTSNTLDPEEETEIQLPEIVSEHDYGDSDAETSSDSVYGYKANVSNTRSIMNHRRFSEDLGAMFI